MNQDQYLNPAQWIAECETAFSTQLATIARKINEQKNLKFICLTGPTCSGKTTAANLLIQHLRSFGRNVQTISIDDFYFDKEILHQKANEQGRKTPDYDSVQTIDLKTLKTFISDCMGREECLCPIFDFPKGKRTGYRHISCGKEDLFIMEGIQVLYPEIISMIDQYPSIAVYIAPQSEIHIGSQIFPPHELRLLRRLVRDYKFRDTLPEKTFAMWDSVRENEEKNIFPYISHCSLRIDSTMPYEIGVLKPYLFQILPDVPEESAHKAQAEEILGQLKEVISISDQHILPNSLYKEFI